MSNGTSTAQAGDPLGEFIDKNMPAWEQRQANYDRTVEVFGRDYSGRLPGTDVADADKLILSNQRTDSAKDSAVINTLIGAKADRVQANDTLLRALAVEAEQERALRNIADLADAYRASGMSGATGDVTEFMLPSDQGSGVGLRVGSRVGLNLQTIAEGINPNGGPIDQFVRGFSSHGSDWSVLEGEKPLAYSIGSAARSGLGVIYDGLTGAGDFRAAGRAFDQGRYVEGAMYGLRGIGSAGMTAMTLGDYALARASVQSTGLRLTASETGSGLGINPRLQQRLEAWRDYQARGGQYDMQRWVQSTQGAPWATGFQSGYGKWINSVESMHGNSLLSKQPATLYQLYTDEGEFLKWGISQSMNTRYSGTFMADKRIFEYAAGRRVDMLRLEREMVETRPGPFNLEPWAGRRNP